MGNRLQGKVALITGAGNGIGREAARLFASEGASIVVADKVEDAAHETVRMITNEGGKAVAITTDVTQEADVKASVELATETFGKLDILLNNAGVGTGRARIPDVNEADWDFTFNVNVKGVFFGLKYAIPAMVANGGGSIVNTASVAGLVATATMAPYGASKAAVIQLTKTAAVEWAKRNIRVNCVCPTWTKTNMVDQLIASINRPDAEQRLLDQVPLGKMGHVSDIAQAMLYLASDESAFVTGIALPLDGGLTAQ